MDDPRHATLRKLVAEGFKPRAVSRRTAIERPVDSVES